MMDQTDCENPKRLQIIEAAVAEFRERGFPDASMDRISARAGVSKRTVYKYFESKEKLFAAIAELMSARMAAELDITYTPTVPIAEQLTRLAEAEGRIFQSREAMAMARMLLGETLRAPEVARRSQARIDAHAVFSRFLADAAADGALRIDCPDRAASEFVGLLKARAFWPHVLGGTEISAEEMADVVRASVEMMLARYGTGA
ncbi:putative HTH-type transcriptional regulator TtgW [Pseudoruegeria aquimaris]|uniref:Putative HTH-type transcriptional regulator TtgW n=1 Tax=Pseudoruegeria aquimaris TaxID=393663 RepID=A0A1Y5TDV4_9RHOB|nr:TetR/AcrR family transcriptional regulator [Pseudoruegeria aquimaris]SLN59707.1 putative HTH-type transcriptional regulator TtgW [Pseudoruegeria aquimaris]